MLGSGLGGQFVLQTVKARTVSSNKVDPGAKARGRHNGRRKVRKKGKKRGEEKRQVASPELSEVCQVQGAAPYLLRRKGKKGCSWE